MYTYIPSPLSLPHTHPPRPPLEAVRHQLAEPPVLYNSFLLAIHSTREDIHVSAPLPVHPTLSRPHCVHKPVLYAASLTFLPWK